ncbi:MAG: head maturation protease, ClpP-related [Sulfitobacter pontiacus]|uniref:head maturation protease, ClpP-related n=1 Tax=Roseobacteraceae TaxID=2854170 RepID=UPI003296FCD9
MTNAATTDNTISVLDVIGEDFWGEGVTAKRVSAALRSIGAQDVVVNINSPGGDFFEGLAIYNLLRDHPHKVTVKVLGMAASAASIIAMAGDEIQIARAGFLMIHNTQVVAAGDRNTMREIADWQETMDSVLADIYAYRVGIDRADVSAMLDAEEWFSGTRAVEAKFADKLLDSDQVETKSRNSADRQKVSLRMMDSLLAQAKQTRSERRDILNDFKGAMRDAGPTGKQDAAVSEGLQSLLTQAKNMKGSQNG